MAACVRQGETTYFLWVKESTKETTPCLHSPANVCRQLRADEKALPGRPVKSAGLCAKRTGKRGWTDRKMSKLIFSAARPLFCFPKACLASLPPQARSVCFSRGAGSPAGGVRGGPPSPAGFQGQRPCAASLGDKNQTGEKSLFSALCLSPAGGVRGGPSSPAGFQGQGPCGPLSWACLASLLAPASRKAQKKSRKLSLPAFLV